MGATILVSQRAIADFNERFSDEGKPISKKAYKKLQKEKEKAERKAATAAKLAEEKAAREASNVVSRTLSFCSTISELIASRDMLNRTTRRAATESCL